jgi:hypothetical protein
MNSITTGLYKSTSAAADALRMLEQSGVPLSDINVISSTNLERVGLLDEPHSKAPEGIALGAVGGGTVGAVVAGIGAAGSIATGGASLGLVVAGPVVATLMGAGAGAVAGGVVGGMVGAAIAEHDLKFYKDAISKGSVLIGVKTADTKIEESVRATLEAAGAEKISRT